MKRRWLAPLAPLSGVASVVLVFVAFGPVGGSTPNTTDAVTKVQSFYHGHYDRELAAGIMVMLAALFMAWFGAALREAFIARDPATRRLGNVVLVAGGMLATGMAIEVGVHFALNDSVHHGYLVAVPALNALDNDLFVVLVVPLYLLVLAIAAASLRYRLFSRWIGWPAVIIAVAVFTPAAFVGLLAALVVLIAVSVIVYLWQRRPATAAPGTPGAAERVEATAV